jgi:hypothetical protein
MLRKTAAPVPLGPRGDHRSFFLRQRGEQVKNVPIFRSRRIDTGAMDSVGAAERASQTCRRGDHLISQER